MFEIVLINMQIISAYFGVCTEKSGNYFFIMKVMQHFLSVFIVAFVSYICKDTLNN